MRLLAVNLLRRAANYVGGASTGMAMSMAAGADPVSAVGITGVLGLVSLCLVTETATDAVHADDRLLRVETWLEELVRRHGRLDAAILAIAEGRDTNELVSRSTAHTLGKIFVASEDEVSTLPEQDEAVRMLLANIEGHLTQLDARVLADLDRQTQMLARIGGAVQHVASRVDALHLKVDDVTKRRNDVPSEHELSARAIDEQDNCRLRSEALQALLDHMEYTRAHSFAIQCDAWLKRARKTLPPLVTARLLESLLEEATISLSMASRRDLRAVQRLHEHCIHLDSLVLQLDEPDQRRLSSHIAYIDAFVNGAAAGLARLDGRSDPFAIRRRLAILLDAGQYFEAVELIRGTLPMAEWVEKALIAAGHCGDWAEATRLLDWALDSAPGRVTQRCRLLFADLVIQSLSGETTEPSAQPSSEVKARLERSAELLRPLSDAVLALPEPRYEVDYNILRLATEVADQLDQTAEMHKLVPRLARHRPFELTLGVLAVRGRIEPESDWPQRLRLEGESSFERRLIAAALEGRIDSSRESAFRSALRLATDASTPDQRKRVHGLLMQLAQDLGSDAERQVEELAPSLVGTDDRQAQLWNVVRRLRSGNTGDVDSDLEQLRDSTDSLWLQIHGQRLLDAGKTTAGVSELAEAARLLDQPEVLESVAGLALAHKQWERAAQLLDRVLVLRPDSTRARTSLAMALYGSGHHGRAAHLLRGLAEELPHDPQYAVNAAACLLRCGQPEDAAEVLSQVCDRPNPPLHAVIGLAQILVERGQPKQAFELASRHRDRFWSEYQFVGSYWSIAFSAENEDAGHQALVQMQVLQAQGAAPAELVVEKTLDDLLEMSRAHHEQQRAISSAVLRGQMSWHMAAEWQREPAYRAWGHRTGTRRWVFEHPVNISESTVYCTNGFTALITGSSRHLVTVTSTGRGHPVAIDLSALITLQQLGMLQTAAEFCVRLHVPEVYLFKMFWDNIHLSPHQPSRRTVLEELRLALAADRIHVAAGTKIDDLRRVDEHYPQDRPPARVYHLRDLAEGLRVAGVATDKQMTRLAACANRPQTVSEGCPPLAAGDSVLIAVSTLSTLHFCGLLSLVVDHFCVYLTPADYGTVQGESAWFDEQKSLQADHCALWDFIRDDTRVERHVRCTESAGEVCSEDDVHESQRVSLAALHLSQRLELPLLADDRCLQALALNSRPASASSSFGTSQLLKAMAEDGHITCDQYADGIHSLMKMRYRFIIPDSQLLTFWANRSMTAPPGPDLLAVSTYLRACLRDPGLFGGFEATDPPETIAMKLYQSIEAAVGDFLGTLWSDERIAEDRTQFFTRWSVAYLLPSPPGVMEPRIRILGDMGNPLLWSSLLVRLALSSGVGHIDRARRGVMYVGAVLGLQPHAVIRAATEVIDGIRDRSN